jgi:CheY-like chemotaxis protein
LGDSIIDARLLSLDRPASFPTRAAKPSSRFQKAWTDETSLGHENASKIPMEHLNTPRDDQKTILVATNEPATLDFISGFLAKGGYYVLSASGGDEAVRRMTEYQREIHLLLSALEMPGVNGLGLAAQVSTRWPNVKVLLMSEYGGGTLVLNEGWHFLSKTICSIAAERPYIDANCARGVDSKV